MPSVTVHTVDTAKKKKILAPVQAILNMGGETYIHEIPKGDLHGGHFHPGPCFLCSSHTAKKNLAKDKLNHIFLQISSVASVFPSPGGLTAGFSLPPAVQTVQRSLDLRQQSHFSASIQLKSFICEHYILKWFLNHSVHFVIFFL